MVRAIFFIVGVVQAWAPERLQHTQFQFPAKCDQMMDAWCNANQADAACVKSVVSKGGTVPLQAAYGPSHDGSGDALRCYSPSCFVGSGPRNGTFKRGCGLYCTRPELAQVLQNCTDPQPPPSGREMNVSVANVWGDFALACGQIRTPELVATPSALLLFGQCRSANASNTPTPPDDSSNPGDLGDDMRSVRIVLAASTDGGATWSSRGYVTAQLGTSVGVALYDSARKQLVFQYQTFTSSNPYTGNRLVQKISKDDGVTWGVPVDITHFIDRGCNQSPGGQVCGAAGSRVVTSNGRLVFAGHAAQGVCVWYSDDGGATYQVNKGGLIVGNEISIADLGNSILYMNGRGTNFPWAGTRASYWSYDDGETWTNGTYAANLVEPNTFGCDGAVTAAPLARGGAGSIGGGSNGRKSAAVPSPALSALPPRLFFSEPRGPSSRISLRVWCSKNAGKTWQEYVELNPGEVAAYSALYAEPDGKTLVVVWEQQPTMLAYRLDISNWCL